MYIIIYPVVQRELMSYRGIIFHMEFGNQCVETSSDGSALIAQDISRVATSEGWRFIDRAS